MLQTATLTPLAKAWSISLWHLTAEWLNLYPNKRKWHHKWYARHFWSVLVHVAHSKIEIKTLAVLLASPLGYKFKLCLLEYITYIGALTINLSFWLSWFLDKVLEVSMTRGHEFESQPPLIYCGIFSPRYEDVCAASTHLAQMTLVWVGVLEYITYHGTSTISLIFWLCYIL